MSNVIVEGFGTYGIGDGTLGNSLEAVAQAMLSGIWAERVNAGSGFWGIGHLPWDPTNPDLYLYTDIASFSSGTRGWRRVLPAALNVSRWSFLYAVSQLPSAASGLALDIRNAANNTICALQVQTTGAIALLNYGGAVLAVTAGPVVTAENAQHWEAELNVSAQTFKLYVNGLLVMNASGLVFTQPGSAAQFAFLFPSGDVSVGTQYGGSLIVRDNNGSFNNTFPIGERKVATLFVNSDDVAHQGWSNHPIHRFGVGVLDTTIKDINLTQQLCGVTTGSTFLLIGSGDFTIEGQYRFQSLPINANKAVLFGRWDEVNNKRSYQLYLGGPNLDHGLLTFRTSTDGLNGTVVNKLQWIWTPDPGRWYEIALVRAAGELLLFIDGVQQGLPIADTDIYFAGDELFGLGVQCQATAPLANTNFIGWMDEFRVSIGLGRYTSNYAPHTAAFPRNSGDPNWGTVAWLSSWDNGVVADDGPHGIALTALNGTAAITPNDGAFDFQSIDQNQYPFDDNFIEAALIAATDLLTFTANPANGNTVTLGTKAAATPAVYTFKTVLASAFDVLIGANIAATAANLISAINLTAGIGTTYGTGTTANLDAGAVLEPSNQVLASALTPGTVGNSIAASATGGNCTWASATLLGGLDIPPYSQFGLGRMPSNTSIVDSLTLGSRQWKTDAGVASSRISLIGAAGGVLNGQTQNNSTTPTVVFDTFEVDPDAPTAPLSPTAVLLSKVRVNRLT